MNERELFEAALQITDSDARAAFLDQRCGTDNTLRDRIVRFLAEHDHLRCYCDLVRLAEDITLWASLTGRHHTPKKSDRLNTYPQILEQFNRQLESAATQAASIIAISSPDYEIWEKRIEAVRTCLVELLRRYNPHLPDLEMVKLAWDAIQNLKNANASINCMKFTTAESDGSVQTDRPNWNEETRTLSFGSWSHVYKKHAPSQEKLLAAFHKADWPCRVSQGLPDNLANVLRNLRMNLGENRPITFEGDGASGARWRVSGDNTDVS